MKLGDIIAVPAQVVARGLDITIGPSGLGVYHTPMVDCNGCKGRQARLNDWSDSIIERFTHNREETMPDQPVEKTDYVMAVVIKATDLYDPEMLEIAKWLKDKGCSIMALNPIQGGGIQVKR